VHEDAGISFDGDDGWAGAHWHIAESVQLLGVVVSTDLIATPSKVFLSAVFEESLLNDIGVFLLGLHLTHDISHNFVRHCFHGFLSFFTMFHGSLEILCSDVSIKVKLALGLDGALSHELMSWWSTGESLSIGGKAFSECVSITLRSWLNPHNEVFNDNTSLSNDFS